MKWFLRSLEDNAGKPDFKRIIPFISFLVCVASWFTDVFFGKAPQEFIFWGFMAIATAGMGLTIPQYFRKDIPPASDAGLASPGEQGGADNNKNI